MEEKLLHQSKAGFEQITISAAPRTEVSPVVDPNGSVIIVISFEVILKLESPNQEIVIRRIRSTLRNPPAGGYALVDLLLLSKKIRARPDCAPNFFRI